jgi:N-acetylmuramoyl-L-alanine amidase
MRQTLRSHAATIRPGSRIFFAFFIALSLFSGVARADKFSTLRETARAQFDRAEKDRQALEARPENSRSLKDYTSLVASYRRVCLITPRAAEVPRALNQVAELYRTIGDLFDEKYYQSAVDSYQFLLREYPTSQYREAAMLAIARIAQDDLHDPVLAQKSYEEFLAMHPRSAHAAEVRATLDRLRLDAASAAESDVKTPVVKDRSPSQTSRAKITAAATDTKQDSPRESVAAGSRPQVTRVRTWNADTYTRIVIDVGAQLKYQAARISGPDRIYFDIENAKISPALLHTPIEVEGGGFLKGVRIAKNQLGVVRVVLEVNHVKDYSVFLLPDPYRLVVDVYGSSAAAEEAAGANAPAPGPTTDIPMAKLEKPAKEIVPKILAKTEEKSPSKPAAIAAPKVEVAKNNEPVRSDVSSVTRTPMNADVGPLVARPASSKKRSVGTKVSAHDQAEEMGPASIPEPTREGQRSLTRALGLKIGRIVIDAGHGGHDTGTIGPSGLMEKDLCLDVSLRVGRLIEQRLPGAQVVFTRDDDTFVPLEQRTTIANDARADLFLSVHANSSPDHKARGIETYYLNFTGSSGAMEVAARENALSGNAVHDLQDIVKKIARNEKIEESRDLAGNIQDSLAKRMENLNRGERDRGVRKAPFVVLIGANMPSVLSEISFLSNPADEQWLKKPENRQRVAEGLYRGIERYLQSTNSLTFNQIHPAPGNRAGIVARTVNAQ